MDLSKFIKRLVVSFYSGDARRWRWSSRSPTSVPSSENKTHFSKILLNLTCESHSLLLLAGQSLASKISIQSHHDTSGSCAQQDGLKMSFCTVCLIVVVWLFCFCWSGTVFSVFFAPLCIKSKAVIFLYIIFKFNHGLKTSKKKFRDQIFHCRFFSKKAASCQAFNSSHDYFDTFYC